MANAGWQVSVAFGKNLRARTEQQARPRALGFSFYRVVGLILGFSASSVLRFMRFRFQGYPFHFVGLGDQGWVGALRFQILVSAGVRVAGVVNPFCLSLILNMQAALSNAFNKYSHLISKNVRAKDDLRTVAGGGAPILGGCHSY